MKSSIKGIIFMCSTTFSCGQTQGIKIDGDILGQERMILMLVFL